MSSSRPTDGEQPSVSPAVAARLAELSPQQRRKLLAALLNRRRSQRQRPVSFAQRRLWFLNQLVADSAFYHSLLALEMTGPLDRAVLQRSLDALVSRHEMLRTTFVEHDGEPYQLIGQARPLNVQELDLTALSAAQVDEEVRRHGRDLIAEPFDLEHGPLLRTRLLRLTERRHVLLLAIHHIAYDGWSNDVLIRELRSLYAAYLAGHPSTLVPLTMQYADYAEWQQNRLTGPTLEGLLSYWRTKLSHAPVLDLPTDYPRPPLPRYEGGRLELQLSAARATELERLSREQGATLFMTVLAALNVLLSRYSGQDDIVVGTPYAGRNHKQVEGLIGCFINSLVLRTELSGDPTFREVVHQVRGVTLDAFEHAELPFERLVEELQIERDTSRNPLFQVLFMLQSDAVAAGAQPEPTKELSFRQLSLDSGTIRLDLEVYATRRRQGLSLLFNYRVDLFERSTIKRMLHQLDKLLAAAVTDPDRAISEIQWLSPAERRALIAQPTSASAYPEQLCMHQLVERQAARTSQAVAVSAAGQQLRYGELNEQAERLADALRSLGIGRGALVGIHLERGVSMVVALLGALKTGAGYVPLDPRYPAERIAFMLADAQIKVLLTTRDLAVGLPPHQAEVLCLDDEGLEVAPVRSGPEHAASPEDIAYVIYTSGSTGKPKGVQIPHCAVVNFLTSMAKRPGLSAGDVWLSVTTLSFDISVMEIFLPLSCGAEVTIASSEQAADGSALSALLEQRGVTVMQATPATWRLLIAAGWRGDGRLKALCGGEAWGWELARALLERCGSVWNMYGPTETTIWSAIRQLQPDDGRVMIGGPIANTQLYVLDEKRRLVPPGVPGELYIGGLGLARGYLGRPELTAERFVPNPLSDAPSSGEAADCLYRTGDRVRDCGEGGLLFVGRLDHQVKLRGHRIELGEIESVLSQHRAVRQAVVVVRQDAPSDQRLISYVIVQEGVSLSPLELRGFLRERLPAYMVPTAFMQLDAFPLTPNGKLDRRALPQPVAQRAQLTAAWTAPRSPQEQLLADIWSRLLRVSQVGTHDDFFELGGHSLLATQLASRVRDALGIELPLIEIFKHPTIFGLAERLEALRAERLDRTVPPLRVIERTAGLPLSFQQQRLWLLDQLDPGNSAYNMPMARQLSGPLDFAALQRSLQVIVERHESLRTTFHAMDGVPQLRIAPRAELPIEVQDLTGLAADVRHIEVATRVQQEAHRPFELDKGPLVRVGLLKLAQHSHVLMLTLHHIIADAWSVDVMFRELAVLYAAFVNDETPALAELPIQYVDYAYWQRGWLTGASLERELTFWRTTLGSEPPVLDLPLDRPRPRQQRWAGASQSAILEEDTLRALRQLAADEHVTLFMVLLAAFKVLLSRYCGQQDIIVGTPVSGRQHTEVEGLIGFFINTLVLRSDLSGEPSFRELLKRVRSTALAAYGHQEIPFEKLVEELSPERDLSINPIFQVMCNMIDVSEHRDVQLPELQVEQAGQGMEIAKFDLTLYLFEGAEQLSLRLNFKTDLFDSATISAMLEHYMALLRNIAAEPNTPITALPLESPERRRELSRCRNDVCIEHPFTPFESHATRQLISARFMQQVRRDPQHVAVQMPNETWTYRQIAGAAQRVAGAISIRAPLTTEAEQQRVALLFEPGGAMLAALMGVLAAGHTYVPLDPSYPRSWLREVLKDTRAIAIVTDERQDALARALLDEANIINLDALDVASGDLAELPQPAIGADALAYIRYTSGSTGRPKGVMQSHRGLLQHIQAYTNSLHISSEDKLSLLSSYTFDGGLMDVYTALLNGATLCPLSVRERTPEQLAADIERAGITIYHSTPSVFRYLASGLEQEQLMSHVRLVVFGGEETRPSDIRLYRRHFSPSCWLINGLGATETSQGLQFFIDHGTPLIRRRVPVGYPIEGSEVVLLDERGRETDVRGEIGVLSDHVALGYWKRPELTAAVFSASPYGDKRRLYCTGDLGRRLADGRVEWLGRKDDQVKIRGYRVEPDEVAVRLREHAVVQQAAVLLREVGPDDVQLWAYVVLAEGEPDEESVAGLKEMLGAALPKHMLPAGIVVVDALPRTPGGKIDRRALAALKATSDDSERAWQPPSTLVEEQVAGIFADLLDVERVGANSDFFALGGHSLMAARVVSRVRERLGVELPLVEMFRCPVVAELAARIEALRVSETSREQPPRPVERRGPPPLSFAQQRFWFLEKLQPETAAFNLHSAVQIQGQIDVDALSAALTEIVGRHAILRTSFVQGEHKRPVQHIAEPGAMPLSVTDLSLYSEAERASQIERLSAEQARAPFDLEQGPMLRIQLLKSSESDNVLLVTMHHIVCDAWSMGIFWRELIALYGAYVTGRSSPLRELPLQYADVAAWQRQRLTGERRDGLLSYWTKQLTGAPPLLSLPTDRQRPALQTFAGARQERALSLELSRAVKSLAAEHDVTLFMTLLAAFKVLLMRYSAQDDVVVGVPVSGRTHAEMEELIGLFVGSLVLRTDLSSDPTFVELLARVRAVSLGAFEHQALPFEQLVEALSPARDTSRHPLFQVMFVLQNTPAGKLDLPGLSLKPIETERVVSPFELTLFAYEANNRVVFRAEYKTDLFEQATIARLLQHLEQLLQWAVHEPEQALSQLSMLSEPERQQLAMHNQTRAAYPEVTLHALVARQASTTPDAVAVSCREQSVCYGELQQRAELLARKLIAMGIGRPQRVAISLERGIDQVVAMLGVLSSGAAYVPLDPSYPAERLRFIMADAKVSALVTQRSVRAQLSSPGLHTICVDDEEATSSIETATMDTGADPNDIAYVIYTSGSTGQPKGVEIRHRSVVSFLTSMQREPGLSADDVMLSVTTLSFDIAVLEIFLPLITGAQVVLVSQEEASGGEALRARFEQVRPTIMQATPATWRLLLEAGWSGDKRLKLLCGGEAWSRRLADALLSRCGSLWNMYGPTETTIWSAVGRVRPGSAPVAIGGAIANTQLYVLDKHQKLVPTGVAGELYIGGVGLARGYLGRPELSAERFLPDPFSTAPAARMYRTGDLVRRATDGTLRFLGRVDSQVKVRGFRIELGEIEAVLAQHPQLREVAVVVSRRGPEDTRLVAYICPTGEDAPSESELRGFLGERLPHYMVPSTFMVLEALPLTPNGKIDRRALPVVDWSVVEGARLWQPPTSHLEQELASIYAELLGVERVGAQDHFFELGGHSLLAAQLINRVHDKLQLRLPLVELFSQPVVAALAVRMEALRAQQDREAPLTPDGADDGGAPPLSFSQQRFWFLEQMQPGTAAFNMHNAVRLSGALDVEALRAALTEIVRRHAVLRTSFVSSAMGSTVQQVAEPAPLLLEQTDLTSLSDDEQHQTWAQLAAQEARAPFDLRSGPVLRVRLLRLGATEHVLLLTVHHIVADAWSLGIFWRELVALYAAFRQGAPSPLRELPLQYTHVARWQHKMLHGERLDALLSYWTRQLRGAPPLLEWPTDRPRPAQQSFDGARRTHALSKELTSALRRLAARSNATLFMVLLAGFKALIERYTRQPDVVVGVPVAGRDRVQTEELIGLFVNSLVFRTDLSGDPSFSEALARVREVSLEAYAHQDLPFERLVQALSPERDMSRHPLFQVMFVLQNAPRERLLLPGLTVHSEPIERTVSQFDLTLFAYDAGAQLTLLAEYKTALFEGTTIDRMLEHLGRLLQAAVDSPTRRLSELSLLSPAEQRQQLLAYSGAQMPYPRQTLHSLVAQQAECTPDAPAVRHHDETLSYGQLLSRSRSLARRLMHFGIGRGERVGVMVERGLPMVVSLLGVLMSGAAYVPLDPSYPVERLRFIVSDAQLSALVTESSLSVPVSAPRMILLDGAEGEPAGELNELEADGTDADSVGLPPGEPSDVAYVIYTSGSTGRPKGVQIPHRAVVSFLAAMQREPGLSAQDVILSVTTLSFDIAVLELFLPLITGAQVVLAGRQQAADGAALRDLLSTSGATVMQATPATWRLLIEAGWAGDGALKALCGGEAWGWELAKELLSRCGAVWNMYGPTETTVWSAVRRLEPGEGRVLLGAPITNTQLYVLDAHQRPVATGIPGELYIGGAGLARGYWQRPQLTAERFVANPFEDMPGERLYRTGDEVRRRQDGSLEFLGRLDQQIKLRGYRIELGEIEALLSQHAHVRQAVVVVREDNPDDQRLVAYIIAAADSPLATKELRGWLGEHLPQYMVPAAFVLLEQLPLTPNGKLDRRALPAPDTSRGDDAGEWRPATTLVEERLADIYGSLLAIERVGAGGHFFELGGHSLLAAQLVSRIRESLEVELPLIEVFAHPTVDALAARVEVLRAQGAPLAVPAITPADRDGALPLSSGQQRFWFLEQLQPGTAAFNMHNAVRLEGVVDASALRAALTEVVRRHEILRTTFIEGDEGQPVQRIAEPSAFVLEEVDLNSTVSEEELSRQVGERARVVFDIARGPLLRCCLLRLSDAESVLLVTIHHIVADAWSMGVFWRELAALYSAFTAGEPSPLRELPIQYADVVQWQREHLSGERLEEQLSYWRGCLGGAPPLIELPTDRPRPPVQTFRGAQCVHRLNAQLTQRLRELARRCDTTLFMVLLAGFNAMLQRYSSQTDIVVGVPIAGRTHVETEDLIGLFVNSLAFRTDLSGDPSFAELLGRVREVSLGAYAHQQLPFEQLVEALKPPRDMSRHPVFQVMFVLQNAPAAELSLPQLSLRPMQPERTVSQLDLTLFAFESGAELLLKAEYKTDLFDESTITRLLAHLENLLREAAAQPQQRLSQLSMLSAEERERLLFEHNRTQMPYPQQVALHELVAQQAARTPAAIAAVFQRERLDYAELWRRSKQLAHKLAGLGIGRGDRVGIFLDRGLPMLVGLLGILAAGAAYIPLDPNYPMERLRFILTDAEVRALITDSALSQRVPAEVPHHICLDVDWDVPVAERSDADLPAVATDDLAYIIYTSGSTGRPKGVEIPHRAVVSFITSMRREPGLSARDVVLSVTTLSFDIAVLEIFLPLTTGAQLVLVPAEVAGDGIRLEAQLADSRPTFMQATPTTWQLLLEAGWPGDMRLKALCGGEAWSRQLADRLLPRVGSLWNMYGPTETTIWSAVQQIEAGTEPVLIGPPIANTQLYVLDEQQRLLAEGVPGELYIGGEGLARGYLGRAELTAERFINHPFDDTPGARLYRTGDRVRRRPGGKLEFLGRLDHQVKVRGFRIELGEIEAAVAGHRGVREVVVAARELGPDDVRLIAYLSPEPDEQLVQSELIAALRDKLPEYMVPGLLMTLAALPRTPNGKIDRAALPLPERTRRERETVYQSPTTEMEKQLAEIWKDLLRLDQVSLLDNFFDLGGHSLLSMRVVARLERETGVRLNPGELILQTLGQIAAIADARKPRPEAQAPQQEHHNSRAREPQPRRRDRLRRKVLSPFRRWMSKVFDDKD